MNNTRPKTIFSHEYRIVDVIGEGGMGRVYRALQTSRNRVVAVKVLTASDRNAVQRAINEARIQQGLRHPNIVEFYEQVEWDNRPCLVMEYVAGVTLAEQLQQRGAMPVHQALAIFSQIVSAVAYIHEHDIIHRDIKAANIRLTADGCAKLLDFGIAKNEFSPQLTQTGFVVGTVEYLAPEQINRGQLKPQRRRTAQRKLGQSSRHASFRRICAAAERAIGGPVQNHRYGVWRYVVGAVTAIVAIAAA